MRAFGHRLHSGMLAKQEVKSGTQPNLVPFRPQALPLGPVANSGARFQCARSSTVNIAKRVARILISHSGQ